MPSNTHGTNIRSAKRPALSGRERKRRPALLDRPPQLPQARKAAPPFRTCASPANHLCSNVTAGKHHFRASFPVGPHNSVICIAAKYDVRKFYGHCLPAVYPRYWKSCRQRPVAHLFADCAYPKRFPGAGHGGRRRVQLEIAKCVDRRNVVGRIEVFGKYLFLGIRASRRKYCPHQ